MVAKRPLEMAVFKDKHQEQSLSTVPMVARDEHMKTFRFYMANGRSWTITESHSFSWRNSFSATRTGWAPIEPWWCSIGRTSRIWLNGYFSDHSRF